MSKKNFEDLQEILWHFASHRTLTVAAQTGILHHLASGPATPDAVAGALGLALLPAAKIIRALNALGVLEPVDDHRYQIVESLRPLLDGSVSDLGPFIAHSHSMYERWGENLEDWVRGKQPAQTGGGPPPAAFAAAMQALGTMLARKVAAAIDLSGVRRMLDVGGSLGHYAKAFCEAQPAMTATVLDKPAVAELGREAMRATPLADRIQFVGGDYLQSDYLQGREAYDLVLDANILHQETADHAAAIVSHSATALAPNGRLVVVDFIIDERQHEHLFGALFAINMRSFGDTYTEATIRDWMQTAGLRGISRSDLDRQRWLITGHKAT